MRNDISPKQMAAAIGVSEASVKRWCDKGLIPTWHTPGGHRKLPINEVLQFVRREGYGLVRADVLGLPAVTGKQEITLDRLTRNLEESLVHGYQEAAEQLVLEAYLSGLSAIEICDRAISKVFKTIGTLWHTGKLAIYEERRACEIVNRVLDRLHRSLPTVSEQASYAIGGSVSYDHYEIPTRMVEVALTELGWRAQSMGTHIPLTDWVQALEERQPRLIWLSLSHIEQKEEFLSQYRTFFEVAQRLGTIVALGGRALGSELRQEIKYSVYCDTLSHLSTFIEALSEA